MYAKSNSVHYARPPATVVYIFWPPYLMATQAFASMKESSRRLLGGEPEEKSALQEMEEAVCSVCPSLSWRNRLIGYGACLAAGFCLTFGSMFRLVAVLLSRLGVAALLRLPFRSALHCPCDRLIC